MDEPALDLSQVALSRQKEVVRVFYKEIWDHANTALVPHIFHPDFTFRGSLGPQLVGHQQFVGYVEFVTGALGQYTSDILALGEEDNRVFAKLRFHGYHRRELFGIARVLVGADRQLLAQLAILLAQRLPARHDQG